MAMVRDLLGNYTIKGECTESDVLATAEDILQSKLIRLGSISNPQDAGDFFRMRLAALLHEEFHIMFLDNRHRILDVQKLFTGTIDGASVHIREVIRAALAVNACAIVCAHNHPSQVPEPSSADRAITKELQEGLRYIGVRVLDHLVVGAGSVVSLAARGLL